MINKASLFVTGLQYYDKGQHAVVNFSAWKIVPLYPTLMKLGYPQISPPPKKKD